MKLNIINITPNTVFAVIGVALGVYWFGWWVLVPMGIASIKIKY